MHLVSLEVQGLKSLRDTRIEGLGRYNVFIGKNDSGKSTILQTVRLLQPGNNEVESIGATELLTDKKSPGRVRVSMVFRLSDPEMSGFPGIERWKGGPHAERVRDWRYDVEMRVGDKRWPDGVFFLTAIGPIKGDDYAPVFRVPDVEALGGYQVLQTGHLEMLLRIQNCPMKELLESLPSDHWSSASGHRMQVHALEDGGDFFWAPFQRFLRGIAPVPPSRHVIDELGVATHVDVDPSGANLTQVLEILERNDRARYRVVLSLARQLFAHISDLHFTREGHGVRFRIAEREDQEPLDAFRLSQVGTGIQQALLLATRVALSDAGTVLLIEEPENNLHPGAQRELARWLGAQAMEGDTQTLITTHSTIFASNDEESSTYLVRRDEEEGTKITRLGPGDEAAVKEELGLRNVDLYGCNMVVLCEGDSEMVAMPIILDALARTRDSTLSALGLEWRNLGGAGNSRVQWVEEFLKLLKDIDVKPYILVDDDPAVREGLKRLVSGKALGGEQYHIWSIDKAQSERNASVTSEFEDNWTDDQLVDVASEIAREEGIDLDLDAARFANLCRQSEKRTSKVLEDCCWSERRYDLDKKELNRRLALVVAEEIGSDAKRAAACYQVVEVAQHILATLGVLDAQDCREARPANGG